MVVTRVGRAQEPSRVSKAIISPELYASNKMREDEKEEQEEEEEDEVEDII